MTTYGSLFSGAGGFELGLNKLGWKCKWMSEIEEPQREVLQKNFPSPRLYGDICEIDGARLEPVDVIVGGFPCQTFSKAASQSGSGLKLFYEFTRIVQQMLAKNEGEFPKFVIWENVLGILEKKGYWINEIYSKWSEIGAVVQEHRLLDAQYFGVPQRRRRVIGIVGFDNRENGGNSILFDDQSMPGDTEKKPEYKTTADGSPTAWAVNESWGKLEVLDVMPSLTTGGGKPGQSYPCLLVKENDSYRIRRATPLECERLMGWPDDHTKFRSDGSEIPKTKRYQMCGNGVVAPMITWVGERVEEYLKEGNDVKI